ncbi:MAG: nitroreductase family protein [Verrucomicrobiota bacterium]
MSKTHPLNVPDAIRARRTTKKFKPDPIPEATLHELIELTVAAPSSFNLQPWRIVVVSDPAKREALTKAAYGQAQIATAPVIFVFAVSIRGWEKTLDHTIKTAAELGAWNEKAAAYFRGSVPGFQDSLDDKQREYAVKDAMIAATQLALAAESLGFNSAFMNGWKEDAVKEVIGAKDDPDIAIALLMPIGHSAGSYGHAGRLPREITVFRDTLKS